LRRPSLLEIMGDSLLESNMKLATAMGVLAAKQDGAKARPLAIKPDPCAPRSNVRRIPWLRCGVTHS
jgi:hypothetical protein